MNQPEPQAVDVLVVGAGPIGLTVATLLADQNISVMVVEAGPTTSDEPRAISLVDESLRTLQSLGLVEDVAPDLVWNTGARYLGAKGQPLVVVRPAVARFGYPQKSFFDQPGLTRALVKGAEIRDRVTVVYDTRVETVSQTSEGVTVNARDAEGRSVVIEAQYLVGCDGGRSTVRTASGIAMTGSSQEEPWIVLDLQNDPHDERMAIFHCDPDRPGVIVPGTQGRCRYEFMLLPGEDRQAVLEHEFIASLVAPYRGVLDPADVRRKVVYVSHQLVAERWRDRRVLLAGDAAHLMPPFAGQGLNTGMRDARNLAWKLAAVVKGTATEALLDTYDLERRPHAAAMVQLSHRMGKLIMTADRRRAWLRDTAFSLARFAPSVKQYFATMKFVKKVRITEGCVVDIGDSSGLRGDFLPQPSVIDAHGRVSRLDDNLGRGWALIATGRHRGDPFGTIDASALAHLNPRHVQVLAADRVPRPADHPQLADLDALVPQAEAPRLLLVRPDRIVAADFAPGEEHLVAQALAPLLPTHR
jgi:3-(3-hydroxy-phenyl)propionate hydroxylase